MTVTVTHSTIATLPDEAGVYTIAHRDSGRMYVGSSVSMRRRKRNHVSHLVAGRHCNTKLQRAWNKYGAEAFDFAALLICSPDNLLMYEQRAIDVIKPALNLAPVAGSLRGFKISGRKMPPQSEEARRNKSMAMAGKRPSPLSNAARLKIAEHTRRNFSGKKLTPEHRAKLAAAKRGRKLPEAHKTAIADAMKAHWSRKWP